MKAFGIFIAIASVVATAILVWLFHGVTFGESNAAYMFESEPPEGYDYWIRKAFWADFWSFAGYSSLAVAAGLIPIVALLFATPGRSRKTTMTIAFLGMLFAIAPGAMTVLSVAAGNFHYVFWAPPILLVGCIFGVIRASATLAKTRDGGTGGQPTGPNHVQLMKNKILKLLALTSVLVFLAWLWMYDPSSRRISARYPDAKIRNTHEFGWVMPGFLHSRFNSDDGHVGYLVVELSDQKDAVDLSVFTSPPVFLVVLNRCRVVDIKSVRSWLHATGVVFNDCDLSGLPEDQRALIGPPLPGTTNRYSYGGP